MLCIAFRLNIEDEDLISSLRAKNESLEHELCSLRQKIKEQDVPNGSCVDAEVSALRAEKKRLEELVAGIRNDQQQKADSGAVEGIRELKAQKAELEERLVSASAELEHLRHQVSNVADAELMTLQDEKHHPDTLIAFLENEVQHYKDTAHEQRIRALDLTHELREVLFMPFCVLFKFSSSSHCRLLFCNLPYYFLTGTRLL